MKRGTQKQRILEFMKNNGFITPLEALREVDCMRLGARIWELRNEGYKIKSKRINYRNAWGEAKHYNAYFLEDEEVAQ